MLERATAQDELTREKELHVLDDLLRVIGNNEYAARQMKDHFYQLSNGIMLSDDKPNNLYFKSK